MDKFIPTSTDAHRNIFLFTELTPASFQQYVALLLERLAVIALPKLAGMVRLRGKWTYPGRATGKYYYGVKITGEAGAQAKVDVPASLVASRNIAPGQRVIITGRISIKVGNYGVEVRLSTTDIELDKGEEIRDKVPVQQGTMTIEQLCQLPLHHISFPERLPLTVALIHSTSAASQVDADCIAELSKLGTSLKVFPVRTNMLDPIAITRAIQQVNVDIVMIIRGGGDSGDFEVFNDPRVITALAEQKAHRVIGLGHTGNTTLLDLIADYSANTPAQAGAYVRERIQKRLQLIKNTGMKLQLMRETNLQRKSENNSYWGYALATSVGIALTLLVIFMF